MQPKLHALASSLVALALFAGCGDSEKTSSIVEAASKKASEAGYDLSKLTPEAAKAELSKLVNDAVTKLGSIKDAATAENVSKELKPLIDKLGSLKTALGEKLDLDTLKKAFTDLLAKFKDDPRVQSALKPLLEKVESLTK